MTTWIKVPKPTGTVYTNVNPLGKQQYDDPGVMYDDPNTYYDSVNMNQYTKVTKPVGTVWTKVVKPT